MTVVEQRCSTDDGSVLNVEQLDETELKFTSTYSGRSIQINIPVKEWFEFRDLVDGLVRDEFDLDAPSTSGTLLSELRELYAEELRSIRQRLDKLEEQG